MRARLSPANLLGGVLSTRSRDLDDALAGVRAAVRRAAKQLLLTAVVACLALAISPRVRGDRDAWR